MTMPKLEHDPEQPQTRTQQTSSQPSSLMLHGKGSALAPQLSTADGNLELKNMSSAEAAPAEDHDIMQLARLGDVEGVRKLFDEGAFRPDYCDDEGITPLHWAAINNQYAMCKFLLEYRLTQKSEDGAEEVIQADVNKQGGESTATPAMWAAQRSHYYIVHLLFLHGANPSLADVQGYNILHLATFEGNVFLLVLLLHQNIPVDVPDAQGHTSLMWAAYKGYPACVDLFLRWGADVHATDETGFTALHWGLVKGARGCIQKLVEYGSDRFQPAANGKTPSVMAVEMNTLYAWHQSLKECGYKEDGRPVAFDFPGSSYILKNRRSTMAKFFFFWPFFIMWAMFMEVSHMVVYAGIPIALLTGFSLQFVAQQVMVYAPPDMRQLHKTPWLAGIFAGTLFFVGLRWATTMLPATYSSHPLSNAFFAVSYGLCGYFYFCTMFYEPGYVPKLAGLTEQKATIDQLLQEWKFDEQNFCVHCMVRMPLRSKHCRRCNRCIAKHDHHCPWVYNCVGVNNHRHFFLYLIFLEVGVAFLVNIGYAYFSGMRENGSTECNILSPDLCQLINNDAYTMVLLIWAALQITWVTMLLFVQTIQIARAMTTYENMRGAHHHSGSRAAEAITSALTTGSTSLRGGELGPDGRGPDPAVPDGHQHQHHHQGCFKQWKKILGVDTFVETALHKDKNKSTRNRNPFSRGCITNCKDFWCDPAPVFGGRPNGQAMLDGAVINYTTMYEPPSRMRARRPAERGSAGYERVEADDGELV